MVSRGKWKSLKLKLVDIVEQTTETHLDYIAILPSDTKVLQLMKGMLLPWCKNTVSYIKLLSALPLF